MQDVSGLYALVALVLNLWPIAVMIGIVVLFIALFFRLLDAAGSGSKVSKALRIDKKLIIAMLSVFTLLMTAMAAQGAVGLTLDTQTVYGGSNAALKATGLTSGTEYTVYATGNTETIANYTFTASTSTHYLPVPIPDESDGAFTYNIAASTSGIAASADASVYISLTDPTDFLQTDLFLNIMVPLIIIAIVVAVVVQVLKSAN